MVRFTTSQVRSWWSTFFFPCPSKSQLFHCSIFIKSSPNHRAQRWVNGQAHVQARRDPPQDRQGRRFVGAQEPQLQRRPRVVGVWARSQLPRHDDAPGVGDSGWDAWNGLGFRNPQVTIVVSCCFTIKTLRWSNCRWWNGYPHFRKPLFRFLVMWWSELVLWGLKAGCLMW